MTDLTMKDGNSEYVIATGFNESPDDGDILVGFDRPKLKRQMSELKPLENNECVEVYFLSTPKVRFEDPLFSYLKNKTWLRTF